MEETITITREQYEKLKKPRVVLFAANNGPWTDEELEENAIDAAIERVGNLIESQQLADRSLAQLTPEQFRRILQQAAWAYMKVYVDYVPF